GRRILDFLSGYSVHNAGHNHPAIIAAIKDELDRKGPAMLQSHVPERAGELAERLCRLCGGRVKKVFFASSGSEGVEAAIKFSRAHTGRTGLLHAHGAFHGLTCGALSLMGDPFWRKGFGPLLPDTHEIPFNDIAALSSKLATRKFAALVLEPVQGEAGIRLPDAEYLREAQDLCRRYGTVFVLDEVQAGMFRTGKFLAGHHYGTDPDIVILAKALSAGLATLDVLEGEDLGRRATEAGEYLRGRLRESLGNYEMVKEVRGLGLLCGIEFKAPKQLSLRVPFETFRHIHPAMFGQVVVMRLFRDHNILTQICGNHFMVLKVTPPLMIADEQIDQFVTSIHEVVEMAHSTGGFWSEALGLARRAINV